MNVVYKEILLYLLLIVFISCNSADDKLIYKSNYVANYELQLKDSIIYRNTKENYIGLIKDIKYWRGKILITDHYFKKLWIFDERMNLIKSVGRKGTGPGEYTFPPYICTDNKNIILIDYRTKKANLYDTNFIYIKNYNLPKHIYYQMYPAIKFNDKFILPGASYLSLNLKKHFDKAKSITVCDSAFELLEEILPWDESYKNETPYNIYRKGVLLVKGAENTFYAKQLASPLIHHIDKDLKKIKVFGIKPRFFKEPPNISLEEVMKSFEATADFGSKITWFRNIDYDEKNKLLIVYYVNLYKESWYNRSMLSGEHFLQIYNSNYDCIFDDKVEGILAFVSNGHIYLLTDENTDNIKIKAYDLVKVK
ncbi:MAG: 6-bladed beta-propeller [Melioribacter sp.]|uniref:6-bladed beta-propeller n=1 Tax=Rosettibacter primus TaxID=3111523 RepID=UPI00247EE9A3|nr:6-bladed beta-propeller [Melioribacter sp.]